jgi:hypothetical protein
MRWFYYFLFATHAGTISLHLDGEYAAGCKSDSGGDENGEGSSDTGCEEELIFKTPKQCY